MLEPTNRPIDVQRLGRIKRWAERFNQRPRLVRQCNRSWALEFKSQMAGCSPQFMLSTLQAIIYACNIIIITIVVCCYEEENEVVLILTTS